MKSSSSKPIFVLFLIEAAVLAAAGILHTPSSTQNASTTPAVPARLSEAARTQWDRAYSSLPMSFEANRGQSESAVHYLARGQDYSLFLTTAEGVLVFPGAQRGKAPADRLTGTEPPIENPRPAVVRMQLRGANAQPQVSGEEELPGTSNYFTGNDPRKWITNAPTYGRVRYSEVYPGIDLVYYGHERRLEYDFVVTPGADPHTIRLAFEGSERMAIDHRGDLVLEAAGEEVRLQKPVAYQHVKGNRREVAAEYIVSDSHEVRFKLGEYEAAEPLVIDPILLYSTYLGGNRRDGGNAIGLDASGNIYVAGYTYSHLPSLNPVQTDSDAASDVFVVKLNASGSALLYSAFFGGDKNESGLGLAVHPSGEAYVTGWTDSANFPTVNPLQPALSGIVDVFVARLNASGSALLYSTYLGGAADEYGNDIAVDDSGNAYIAGYTRSPNFPTANPLQPILAGESDVFVTKLNPSGSALVYSTYLGGANTDTAYAIALDNSGNVSVSGATLSDNFPTLNPLQPIRGGRSDAIVAKLNATGSALLYSTYLGGSDDEYAFGIAVDNAGNAYTTGYTYSADFPTKNALQPAFAGLIDGFVSKLNASGSALVYSTYLGGNSYDYSSQIAVDGLGNAYVTGSTYSTNFPAANSSQALGSDASRNAFVAKLNVAGSALQYFMYLGGNRADWGADIVVDASGNAYVTGITTSTNFPLANPFQRTNGGFEDAFISKISSASIDAELRPRNGR